MCLLENEKKRKKRTRFGETRLNLIQLLCFGHFRPLTIVALLPSDHPEPELFHDEWAPQDSDRMRPQMPKARPPFWPAPAAAVQEKKQLLNHSRQLPCPSLRQDKSRLWLSVLSLTWRWSTCPSAWFKQNSGWCRREQRTLVVSREASLRALFKHPHFSTVCCRAALRASICTVWQVPSSVSSCLHLVHF